jgi:hypothetical protein
MAEAEHIVRKSEFAALRNVSPGRVTQWITSGQIGRDALVGEGRDARVRVAVANQHLRECLDPSQRFGLNGITTRLDAAAPAPKAVEPTSPDAPSSAPPSPLVDTVETRIKAEKLRQAELTTRRAEEQDRLSRGVYVLARDAREESTKLAAKLLEAIDGALPDMAADFASQHKIPTRDALHLLRASFNRVRGRISAEYAAIATEEPETVEDVESHDDRPLQ